MTRAQWVLSPELAELLARWGARKPRPVQRAEHRARMLAAMEERYRRCAPLARPESGVVCPPPPGGVSAIHGGGDV